MGITKISKFLSQDEFKLASVGLFIIGTSVISLGLFFNKKYPHKTAYEMSNYQSAAFHGQEINDPLKPPDKLEITRLSNNQEFALQVPINKTGKLLLSFLLKCENECGINWLEIKPNTADNAYINLLTHPLLNQMNWFYFENEGIHVYQKIPHLWTINEIIKSKEKILTEKRLYRSDNNEISRRVVFLEQTESLDGIDVVITSFAPIKLENGWQKVTQSVNIGQASQFDWKITSDQDLDKNPIYLAKVTWNLVE